VITDLYLGSFNFILARCTPGVWPSEND